MRESCSSLASFLFGSVISCSKLFWSSWTWLTSASCCGVICFFTSERLFARRNINSVKTLSLSTTASAAEQMIASTSCWSIFTSLSLSWILCRTFCRLTLSCFCLSVLSAAAETVSWPLCSPTEHKTHVDCWSVWQKIFSNSSWWEQMLSRSFLEGSTSFVFSLMLNEAEGVLHSKRPDTADRTWGLSPSAEITGHVFRSSVTVISRSSLESSLLQFLH